jgi:hypothetical protein
VREREGLISRIRQLGRSSNDPDGPPAPSTGGPGQDELRALETRIVHLEHLLHGLQDSVHRETTRLGERIDEVEARIQPAALGKALSDDARERGL